MSHKIQSSDNIGYLNKLRLLFLGLCLFSFFGCNVSAIILSPGSSDVVVKEGEVVSFKGEAIGGTPFLDDADNSYYGYYWTTGGSPSTSSENEVEVTYDNAGVYVASFTVTDRAGDKDTLSIQVTVIPNEDTGLVAKITSPAGSKVEIGPGESISFSATAYGGSPPYEYYWETGGSPDTSYEQNPDVTFDEEGVYNVYLTVTDSDGNTDTAEIEVTVTSSSI